MTTILLITISALILTNISLTLSRKSGSDSPTQLNDYLRPYRNKLGAKIGLLERTVISGDTSAAEKSRAQKKLDKYKKFVTELEEWERDVVHPLAVKRVELDLDDGVKVNYGKLGSVLEKVKGLNG